MKHNAQGQDEMAIPDVGFWTMVVAGLRLKGLAALTGEARNSLSTSFLLP
jgi:hypothetical protein